MLPLFFREVYASLFYYQSIIRRPVRLPEAFTFRFRVILWLVLCRSS